MSLTVGRTKLLTSLKDLTARWAKVRAEWDDPVRIEFEQEYLDPLEGRVRSAVAAMEHMYDLISRARRDCQ